MEKNEKDTLTPTEKLDAVLWCFFEYKSMHTYGDISEELRTHPDKRVSNYSWQKQPDEILKKLIEDNLIEPEKTQNSGTVHKLTFEGRKFIQDGYYKAKDRRRFISTTVQAINLGVIAVSALIAALGTLGLLYYEYLKYKNSCP